MKLKKQDKLTVLSAFLIGIIGGSYLYLVGYAPEFQSGQGVETEEEVTDFMVIGDMLGDGVMTGSAPAFRIESDGSYIYYPHSEDAEVPSPAVEGEISRALLRELKATLTDEVLVEEVDPPYSECPITSEMIAMYKYAIILDGSEYQISTCVNTSFATETEAGQQLTALWKYFETAE